ncbi:PilZ domain-containing protein [Geobacter sp. AOG2]|uniref:PilZ domain-containing protein n=1 Tax=Geobacter sp. AOG2 TaxID=1566347 RepID=UPI001CC75D04
MSEKQRSDNRVALLTKCQLDIKGRTYNCLVDNISTTGAAIEMTVADHDDIQVGETATLNVLLLSPVTYRCKVVRISSDQIGVQFVD